MSAPAVLLGLAILVYTLPLSNREAAVRTIKAGFHHCKEMVTGEVFHSRLIFFGDKGGKTRVVAIVDILSQSLLKMVHQRCVSVLSNLDQDGTFDQDEARR